MPRLPSTCRTFRSRWYANRMEHTSRIQGTLYVVGLGPGAEGLLTPEASRALEKAEVVVGYQGYLEMIAERIAGKRVVGRALGQEIDRAREALAAASSGQIVALVSSGDAGIYGMGGVVWELATREQALAEHVEIINIPGLTAASSAAARLGAPLAHDWAAISLSDLLTPWEVIVERVEAAARADFAIALYNPMSRGRRRQFPAVAEILLRYRAAATPVGIVENAYRTNETITVVPLSDLPTCNVTMFTVVIIGNSQSYQSGTHIITPRIYLAHSGACRDQTIASTTVRAESDPGFAIMNESFAIIDSELGPEPSDAAERAIVRRMIHASADFEYARTTRCSDGATLAARSALRAGCVIVTDVEMLRAGIRRDLAAALDVKVACALDEPLTADLARDAGMTRTAAGIRRAAMRAGDGVLVAVGNAPTALDEVIRLVDREGWRPACVVGIPVGFVGVIESKRRLVEQLQVPWVTSLGRKGGTSVTAAAINALLDLALQSRIEEAGG